MNLCANNYGNITLPQFRNPFKNWRMGDYLVVLALFGFISVHFFTQFYLNAHTSTTDRIETAKAAVEVFEQNPFARWQFRLANFGYVFKLVLFPAIYFTGYYLARRKYGYEAVEQFAITIFMVSVLNVMNDLGAVLGVKARGG